MVGSLHSRVTSFQYFCQGKSTSSKLFLRQGKVNKHVGDVCTKPREVRVAFNQEPSVFEVDTSTNTMVEYSYSPGILYTHEVLAPFFRSHNLIPIWHDANGGWGSIDTDTGLWTGVVGLVSGIYF